MLPLFWNLQGKFYFMRAAARQQEREKLLQNS